MSDSETDSNGPEVVSTPGKADGDAQAALRFGDSDEEIPVVLGGDVPDDVRETLEASVPDDAPFSIAKGKAGEETAAVPVSGGIDWKMDSGEFQGAGVSDFDRIRDDRIQRIRKASVDYDHRIANWIFTKDDLVPGIAERMKALIVGESGVQVKPADPDSEADQNFADWLTDDVFGEEVRPNEVVSVALRENMKHARAVLRATDLRRLEIQDLTHVRDGLSGDEVYIQDAQSVATLDEDAIDQDGEMVSGTSTVVDYEDVDRRVLKLGEQVFHTRLYKNPPLEAVADDVVNKLVLKRLKARRAEIASIGGIYIKVEPPAGLPEEEYHAKEEVDWSDDPVTKLEKAMKKGIDDAFDTLSDYKAGSIMAIPENWEVESVELPDDDVPLDDQIRGYNKAIANRLLFPLDLFELREGAELSRDTIFKTLITTIEGWRQEFIRVFEQFADVQKEIYDVQGDVEFEFPPLGAEDEEILVQLLNFAGAGGLSRSEVRQLMNRVEGVDLDVDPDRGTPDPSTEPGGPSGQERQRSMEDVLERQGDGDGGDDPGDGDGDGPRQVDTSGDAGRVLDDDVVQGSVGIPGDPLFANVPGVDDPETGFKPGAPDGWTYLSVVDAWTSLGGTWRSCVADMTGEVRSAKRFCAALKDEFLQTEEWRGGASASASVIQASTTYGYRVQADGSAEAASKTSFQIQFDGDLDAAADMLQDVMSENAGSVSRRTSEDDYVLFDVGGGDDSDPVVITDTGDGEFVVAGRGRTSDLFDGLESKIEGAREAPKLQAATFKLEKDASSVRDAASQVRRMVEERVPDGYTADTKRKSDDQFIVLVRDENGDFAGSLVLSENVDGDYVVVGTSNFFDVDRPPVGRRDLTRVEGTSQDDGDGDGSNGGLIGKFLGSIGLQAAENGGPLADVPGLPDNPDVITRPMLEYWLAYLRVQSVDAQATLQADWNPAFHPRGPDGKFVERPFDIPDAIRESDNLDFSQQSGAEILAEISDFEKSAVDDALQDPEISIDGVPDDVDDRSDLKAVATRHTMERKKRENRASDQLKEQVQNADTLDDVPTRTVDRGDLERNDIILVDGEPRSVESSGFNSTGYGRVKKPDGEVVDGFQAGEQVEKVQGAGVMYDLPGVELPPEAGGRNDVPDDMALDRVADVIPKGQDSPLMKPDEGPISDSQMEDVRSTMNDVLERANAPDVAREYGRRAGYVGDDIDRSHNGFRQNDAGEAMTGMALSEGAPASTVRHEMGHGVAAAFGYSNSDNSAAHDMNYWPDIDPDSEQFKRYMVSDEIAAFGPTASATGFDDWADEERQRVLQFSEAQFESWDGRNRATALEPGDVVRFDDTPTPAARSRTLEVVGVDDSRGMSDEVELELRDQDGNVVDRRVEADGSSFFADIEAVNRGATDRDAASNQDATAWVEERSPDVSDFRGPGDREAGEKVRDLVSAANRAFFNMHLTRNYISEDDGESKTIIDGYSSTNAHEVLSQTHELLQRDGPTPPNLKEKIRRLPENHPDLFAKYTDIWSPSPEVQDILADAGVET